MKRVILLFLIVNYSFQYKGFSADSNITQMPVILSIPSIALVDFAGLEKRFTYSSSADAKQIITPSTHNKTWLNYSCISHGDATSVISVNLSSDNLPAEVVIKLDVGENVGGGAGKTGRPIGPVLLKNFPQDIVIDIGTCYTGRGIHKGHQLTYTWEWLSPYNPEKLSAKGIEIAVIFTITTAK